MKIQNFRENIDIPYIFAKIFVFVNIFAKMFAINKNFSENVGIPNIFVKTLSNIYVFENIFEKNTFSNIVMSWLSCPGYL